MPKKKEQAKPEKNKRQLQAEQTKRALMKAAMALFATRGYDAVTVEQITRRAGVAKGSFYSHFSAKEAVLVEHFKQVDDLYEETYLKMSPRLTASQKILKLVDTMCAFCQDECGIDALRVIYANQLLHPFPDVSILNHPGRRIIAILQEIADDGKKAGEVPASVNSRLFAQEVMHLAHGIIYDWCMADNAFDLKKTGHRVFKQLAKTTVL